MTNFKCQLQLIRSVKSENSWKIQNIFERPIEIEWVLNETSWTYVKSTKKINHRLVHWDVLSPILPLFYIKRFFLYVLWKILVRIMIMLGLIYVGLKLTTNIFTSTFNYLRTQCRSFYNKPITSFHRLIVCCNTKTSRRIFCFII